MQEILENYGFSEKEARIYLTVRKLWSWSVATIARIAWLNRITTHVLLKELLSKWVALQSYKHKILYYSVVSPEILLQQMEHKTEEFKTTLPALLQLRFQDKKLVKSEFYEWASWLKNLYMDILTSEVEVLSFTSLKQYSKPLLETLFQEFTPKRVKQWLKVKRIMSDIEENRIYSQDDEQLFRETRLLPWLEDMECDIELYGPNKVAICLSRDDELSGVLLHSESLYKSLTALFKLLRKK